jgi:spermidine synthase
VFIDAFFQPERLVCLDLRPGVPAALQQYLDHRKSGIRAYPGVSQADGPKLRNILAEEFNGPLDLVIDDASHFYGPTKSSFELLFPRLRPLGIYVIEDWDWFHTKSAQTPTHQAWSETSLSTLAIELMVAHGSYPALIKRIVLHHRVLWLQRGGMPVEADGFSLAHYLNLRGKALPPL